MKASMYDLTKETITSPHMRKWLTVTEQQDLIKADIVTLKEVIDQHDTRIDALRTSMNEHKYNTKQENTILKKHLQIDTFLNLCHMLVNNPVYLTLDTNDIESLIDITAYYHTHNQDKNEPSLYARIIDKMKHSYGESVIPHTTIQTISGIIQHVASTQQHNQETTKKLQELINSYQPNIPTQHAYEQAPDNESLKKLKRADIEKILNAPHQTYEPQVYHTLLKQYIKRFKYNPKQVHINYMIQLILPVMEHDEYHPSYNEMPYAHINELCAQKNAITHFENKPNVERLFYHHCYHTPFAYARIVQASYKNKEWVELAELYHDLYQQGVWASIHEACQPYIQNNEHFTENQSPHDIAYQLKHLVNNTPTNETCTVTREIYQCIQFMNEANLNHTTPCTHGELFGVNEANDGAYTVTYHELKQLYRLTYTLKQHQVNNQDKIKDALRTQCEDYELRNETNLLMSYGIVPFLRKHTKDINIYRIYRPLYSSQNTTKANHLVAYQREQHIEKAKYLELIGDYLKERKDTIQQNQEITYELTSPQIDALSTANLLIQANNTMFIHHGYGIDYDPTQHTYYEGWLLLTQHHLLRKYALYLYRYTHNY